MSRSRSRFSIEQRHFLVVASLAAACGGGGDQTGPEQDQSPTEAPIVLPAEGDPLHIFFPGPDDLLHEEERMATDDDAVDIVTRIVQEVLSGPDDPRLQAPFGPSVAIGSVDIAPDGTVFLDLQTADGAAANSRAMSMKGSRWPAAREAWARRPTDDVSCASRSSAAASSSGAPEARAPTRA